MIYISKHVGGNYISWICQSINENINSSTIIINYAISLDS